MSTRLVNDGYGQLELNQVAFRRDGRIEAQCKLGVLKDANNHDVDYVENGMLLAVNKVAGTVGYPTGTDANELIGLHYSAETLYDEHQQGLKYFKLDRNGFLPRIGYLAVGDRFTTNCVIYNDATFPKASENDTTTAKDRIKKAIAEGTVYGVPSVTGEIELVKSTGISTWGVVLQAVAYTTMPDGQDAIKFVVIKA